MDERQKVPKINVNWQDCVKPSDNPSTHRPVCQQPCPTVLWSHLPPSPRGSFIKVGKVTEC